MSSITPSTNIDILILLEPDSYSIPTQTRSQQNAEYKINPHTERFSISIIQTKIMCFLYLKIKNIN
ncbi:hypothetical protein BafPKo_0384 [Borreliella afzelii PKo]|uniref:Uncharacterized protein n=1 Tax=Borreliella afzelii (strain PKo) TaxID=390236 RepID=G0IS29_BORAP|nr:hypothetical protein [Borreliella afzelii]AEL69610.1 hypothetical protein BafPKo_0384 [Borreliella afzelii PKo]